MRGSGTAKACEVQSGAAPTCWTGPLGRLAWTLRELAGLLQVTGRAGRAR